MDKNKIIEAAGKLVAKGAYDKAIKEYQKVLDADPKDVRILQKMGELYQKKNDNAAAATYIIRVAESYARDGFFLKAVAQYKQVLKLDPTLIDINIQLAELHQQLQLMGEAMAYYQVVANHYDKQGDVKKSLDVLRKMVDLDPDNVQSRVKLADLYVRERMNDEAVQELSRAAEHLKRQNRIDDYLRVAERVSALRPDDLTLAKELAELYLQRNDQKRALAKLQICFKADSRDIDTLRLLAVAFQGLGQVSKTVSVYKELARAYAERGLEQEVEQVWQQVALIDPNDAELLARTKAAEPPPAAAALVASAPVTAWAPAEQATVAVSAYHGAPRAVQTAQQTALQPAVAAAAPRPRGDSLSKLLTETDVYVKYGLHDKALEHLRKVFAVEPENIDAHEKAYAIYVASNNHAQAAEQLLNVLRLHTRSGDRERAQPYLSTILQQNPGHPEVPVFLQALRLEGAAGAPEVDAQPAVPADEAILVDSSDDEVIVPDEPVDEPISAEVAVAVDEPVVEAPEYVPDDLMLSPDDAAEAASVEVEPPPVADEPALVAAAEDERLTGPVHLDEEPRTGEFQSAEPAFDSDEADENPTMGIGVAVRTSPVPVPAFRPGPVPGAPMELGEEDQHEAPTRAMKALDPSLLKTTSGYQSDVVARLQSGVEVEAAPSSTVDQDEGFEEAAQVHGAPGPVPVEEPVEAPPVEEPAAEECDEATFFIEQGLYDEAREILETVLIAYPDHQRAAQLLAQVEHLQAGGAPSPGVTGQQPTGEAGAQRDAFDLAQELAQELGDFGADTGADAATASGSDDDYQVSVEEVFAEFKKGLEKVVKPEDVDTHYDLGIAYKEMGLIDDAISEFSIARKGCLGKKKEIDCLTMAGMLHVMKGDYPMAIDAFLQALSSEHATADVERATRFELAQAYEAAGQAGRALAQFMRVQAQDPGYRDVGSHVERLSAIAVPEEEPQAATSGPRKGAAPSRKVGYV